MNDKKATIPQMDNLGVFLNSAEEYGLTCEVIMTAMKIQAESPYMPYDQCVFNACMEWDLSLAEKDKDYKIQDAHWVITTVPTLTLPTTALALDKDYKVDAARKVIIAEILYMYNGGLFVDTVGRDVLITLVFLGDTIIIIPDARYFNMLKQSLPLFEERVGFSMDELGIQIESGQDVVVKVKGKDAFSWEATMLRGFIMQQAATLNLLSDIHAD